MLKVGERAPEFHALSTAGAEVSLTGFKGRKLVLYFYPKADTPGCTQESLEFSALRASFAEAGTEVIGISADPVKAQDAFKAKHGLTVALGSDPTHAMLKAYGVWGEKSMYGKTFMGIVRTTFLIGSDGRILRVWPNVKVKGHAADVLAAAQTV